jgi:hypothetical protein
MAISRAGRGGLLAVVLLGAAACGPAEPYVRYQGHVAKAKPESTNAEVYRTNPPADTRDLGTVVVTCPSEVEAGPFGTTEVVGGCSYEWAIWKAAHRALDAGADGIHSIETSVNGAGKVVSLRASAFIHALAVAAKPPAPALAPPQAAPPAEAPPTVEERLRRLDKLRDDKLITPEEYASKRAEILKDI